jgi:hypothetical protein
MRRGALEKHPGHRGIILGEMDDRRQVFCSPDAGVAKVVRCHALYAEQRKTSPHAIAWRHGALRAALPPTVEAPLW